MLKKYLIIIALFSSFAVTAQKYENLAKTPPMGWNSWNTFACDINDKLIRETADLMVSSGMKDAGYMYVNLDDCWHGQRDSMGFIHANPVHFPNGIKPVADYVHSKGLKIGIYSDAGWNTCGGKPGSRGYEFQDAKTYASWGIDYLKYDWCSTEGLNAEEAYKTIATALVSTQRPIVLSICEWGDNKPWLWGAKYGQLWRTSGDIYHCWNCELGHGDWTSWGILQIFDKQLELRKYAGPNHWNDPDMMEVGNGMSVSEDRSHFSLWCMMAAPLIAGNDIRKMSKETLEILTNKEMIAVDQDALGVQCFKWFDFGDLEVYAKPLDNNELAVCFLNRGATSQKIHFDWKKENIVDRVSGKNYDFTKDVFKIRDLWVHKDLGSTSTVFEAELASHDVIVLRLKK
jgi:alpha-galactosidase